MTIFETLNYEVKHASAIASKVVLAKSKLFSVQ